MGYSPEIKKPGEFADIFEKYGIGSGKLPSLERRDLAWRQFLPLVPAVLYLLSQTGEIKEAIKPNPKQVEVLENGFPCSGLLEFSPEKSPENSEQKPDSSPFVQGEILVKFKEEVSPARAKKLLAQEVKVLAREVKAKGEKIGALNFKEIPSLGIFEAQGVPPGRELSWCWRLMEENPELIDYAEPNFLVRAEEAPNDPLFEEKQWNLKRIKAPEAWEVLKKSEVNEVEVAVLDTGVDPRHPDLNDNLLPGRNVVEDNDNPLDGHERRHGTFVAGIIAAEKDNEIGIAPVAPNVKIRPVKVLSDAGTGTHANVAEGIIWAADQGVKVINMSLGGENPSETLKRAVEYASQKGVLITAAAGNFGGETPLYPANYEEVVPVGATDEEDDRAYFSHQGVEVTAPGVNITSLSKDEGYGEGSGTSAASPEVAGVAGMILGNKKLDAEKAREIIKGTAKDLGQLGWDEEYGAGGLRAFPAMAVAFGGRGTGAVKEGEELLEGVEVCAVSEIGRICDETDELGQFEIWAPPGPNDFVVSSFYHWPVTKTIEIKKGEIEELEFSLQPKPKKTVSGRILDGYTSRGIEGVEMRFLGTPVLVKTNANGFYECELPYGKYPLEVWPGAGYQFLSQEIQIPGGIESPISLDRRPKILVVNGERWLGLKGLEKEYEKALREMGTSFNLLEIRGPEDRLVFDEILKNHDLVLMVMKQTSPVDIAADIALREYLAEGGRLMLFGDDLAYSDKFALGPSELMQNYLNVAYVAPNPSRSPWGGEYTGEIQGKGIFEGLTFSLTLPNLETELDSDLVAPIGTAKEVLSYLGKPGPESKYFPTAAAIASAEYWAITFLFNLDEVPPEFRVELMGRILAWASLPELSITPDKLRAEKGEEINYALDLENPTYAKTGSIPLEVPIPEGASYVGGTGLPKLVWNASENKMVGRVQLPPDGSEKLGFSVRIKDDAYSHLQTEAEISPIEASGLTVLPLEAVEASKDYTWQETEFKWIDTSSLKETQDFYLFDNESVGPLKLGFELPGFGEKIWIDDDASIGFSPNSREIKVFEMDLFPLYWHVPQGVVSFYTNGETAVISWENVPHDFSTGGYVTCQAILRKDGSLVFQYKKMTGPLDRAKIGIRTPEGGELVVAKPGEIFVRDELAIRIIPPKKFEIFLPFVVK